MKPIKLMSGFMTVGFWTLASRVLGFMREILIAVSQWGLLIAIAALGLGTSIRAIAALGWRHGVTIIMTTLMILVVAGGMIALLL